jgi:hypothetical protein
VTPGTLQHFRGRLDGWESWPEPTGNDRGAGGDLARFTLAFLPPPPGQVAEGSPLIPTMSALPMKLLHFFQ